MGGAATHLLPFIHALKEVRPRWLIHLFVSSGLEPLDLPRNVAVDILPRWTNLRRLWWESVQLPRLLRSGHASALLNLTNSAPLAPGVPSIMYQRNALWFDHAWVARMGGRERIAAASRRQLAFLQMLCTDLTIVPSTAMRDFLLGWPTSPRRRVTVIPHAVDGTRFTSGHRSWPPPEGRPLRLLSVGHASPYKNQLFLVHLLSKLRELGCDAELHVTIDRRDAPEYFDQIERTATTSGVWDRMTATGRKSDVERLYREADILVFPSMTESFGFPVLEGMAAQIPIVASRIPAVEGLLRDFGWYFPVNDVDAAAASILEVLNVSTADMTQRMTIAARQAVGFSWASNAAAVAEAIEAACATSTR